MRDKFADVIFEIGKKDKRISALVADISAFHVNFRKKFPKRFVIVVLQSNNDRYCRYGYKSQTIFDFILYRPFEMID